MYSQVCGVGCCVGSNSVVLYFQSIAVEGYETGEHAPGLKLRGTGAYKAAHHIIKVRLDIKRFVLYSVTKQPTTGLSYSIAD